VSGRLKNNMRFVILVPKSLDPAARGRKMPLPDTRPSAKIAKLFPQVDPLKDQKNGTKPAEASAAASAKDVAKTAEPGRNPAAAPVQSTTAVAQASTMVPLPEARPNIAPAREVRRHRYHRYRRGQ
jgi:membrane-bound lytic murein transglycosylase A